MDKFIERIIKQKAIGIIYNIPDADASLLVNRLLDEGKHIVINAHDAYTSAMLRFRLGSKLKVRQFTFSMLPSLIDGNLIILKDADIIKPSYSRVFEDFHKYKIPLLLLMNSDAIMDDLRHYAAYNRVMTIEADFKIVN